MNYNNQSTADHVQQNKDILDHNKNKCHWKKWISVWIKM